MSNRAISPLGEGDDDEHAGQGTDDRPDYEARVTVDLDGYIEDFDLKAIRAYHALDRLAVDVDVAISSSGEGLHLVGYVDDALDWDDRERLRRHLGDDANRIEIDRERHRQGVYTGVLWDEKEVLAGPERAPEDRPGKQRGFRDVYDALDTIDAQQRDPFEDVQALANDGHKGAPRLAAHAGRWPQ